MSGALQAGDLVCVTGANGFIASHLIRDLLQAGYRVRGTVRDPSNADKTAHLYAIAAAAEASDRFELVASDLLKEGSFDAAMVGAVGVCHCAAAVFFSAEDPQRDIVDPSLIGTRNVLESIRKAGTVRRVIHTSSVVAVYGWDKPSDHIFSEADWNTCSTLEIDPYGLAKVEAEKAARSFVDALPAEERFELVHLNPGMVWGPPLIKAHGKASPRLVRDVISRTNPGVPRLMLNVVDVRDVAEAHVRALEAEAPPPRCILVAYNGWMPEMMRQLQSMFPDVAMGVRQIPKWVVLLFSRFDKTLNTAQLKALVGRSMPMSSALSEEAFGMTWRPLAETLHDTASPLIENGWARVKRR
jgi:dihydroflavonol-4-reductase